MDANAAQVAPPIHTLVPDSERPTTVRSLQMLRFVAAFSVVVFHGYIASGGKEVAVDNQLTTRAFGIGAAGVHIFFVISGFVMVLTALRGPRNVSPAAFLTRRLLRIYPIYWLLAAIYVAAYQVMGTPYNLNSWDLIGAILLVSPQSSYIIGPGWTLSYEMYFYLIFGAFLFLPKRFVVPGLSLFMVASVAAGGLFKPFGSSQPIALNALLMEFVAGCWVAKFHLGGRVLPAPMAVLAVAAAIALFAAGIVFDASGIPTLFRWGVPSTLLVLGALSLERIFTRPVLIAAAKLGDSSYFLYLCHILALDVLLLAFNPGTFNNDGARTLFAWGSALLLTALAAAGHRWIEKPMLKLLGPVVLRKTTAARRA